MAFSAMSVISSGAIKTGGHEKRRRPKGTREISQGLSGEAVRRDTPGISSQCVHTLEGEPASSVTPPG
jgi:hypothetical protein